MFTVAYLGVYLVRSGLSGLFWLNVFHSGFIWLDVVYLGFIWKCYVVYLGFYFKVSWGLFGCTLCLPGVHAELYHVFFFLYEGLSMRFSFIYF